MALTLAVSPANNHKGCAGPGPNFNLVLTSSKIGPRPSPISANFTVADQKCHCHPERSEGSRRMNKILRYAQDDTRIIECAGLS